MAVDDSSDVLCTMSGDEKGSENRLGPSVLAEIHVNGVPTTALIDTGSPATIISLDYVLSLMRGEREEGQSPEGCHSEAFRPSRSITEELWRTSTQHPVTDEVASHPGEACH